MSEQRVPVLAYVRAKDYKRYEELATELGITMDELVEEALAWYDKE